MTDDQIEELFGSYGDQLEPDDPVDSVQARLRDWSAAYEEAKALSRAAWEYHGVDPEDPLLREPHVRYDGSGRTERGTGFQYGGGLNPREFPRVDVSQYARDFPDHVNGGSVNAPASYPAPAYRPYDARREDFNPFATVLLPVGMIVIVLFFILLLLGF